ncbi:hypothetical protein GOODEAATRI_020707, partial [Goodea atripinnis]
MTLRTIRNGIHKIDTYLNVALDLFGGYDGLCRYRCSDGYKPMPRPGYRHPPPNGCGSPLFGFQFDLGIPSMTKCCNQHDRCYDTCGREKHDCDEQFQDCLETICRNVQRTLGLAQSVQACESAVTLLFDAVMHLGCKPYLDSQREACVCHQSNHGGGTKCQLVRWLFEEAVSQSERRRQSPCRAAAQTTNKRRGLALIFNQERFFWRLGLNNRNGTNADRYNLERRYVFLSQLLEEGLTAHVWQLEVFSVERVCENKER